MLRGQLPTLRQERFGFFIFDGLRLVALADGDYVVPAVQVGVDNRLTGGGFALGAANVLTMAGGGRAD